jgi:hypothetical protein
LEPLLRDGGKFRAAANAWNPAQPSSTFLFPDAATALVDPNENISFSLDWTANANGSGTLAGTINGVPVSRDTSHASNDSFNAFGIGTGLVTQPFWTGPPAESELQAQLFADNLTYSIVPEPGSIVLMAVGMALLVGKKAHAKARRRKVA